MTRRPLPAEVGPLRVRSPSGPIEAFHHFATVDSSYGFPTGDLDDKVRQRLVAQFPAENRLVVEELEPQGTPPDGPWRVLGGSMHFDVDLSLPWGGSVPVQALTAVGIDPSAAGRGAFRALIEEHLRVARERDAAASILMASEVPLYGRFGYGCATATANWEIDAAHADLRADAPRGGRVVVEHERGDSVIERLDAVWSRTADRRAGFTSRPAAWWDVVVARDETWQGGGKQLLAFHVSDAGQEDGYALYTVDLGKGRQGLSESEITIRELVAVDGGAELDLWRYLAGLPWARSLTWGHAPVDPAPLFWLRDPRQLRRMAHYDFLWLRPLDMSALVTGREFGADGVVRLEVADPLFGELAGRFDLEVSDGRGRWLPGSGTAEAAVSIADLGAAWLGGASLAELWANGLLRGDPAPLRRLDAMLRTDQPPRSVARF